MNKPLVFFVYAFLLIAPAVLIVTAAAVKEVDRYG
jgi:hypothetical protein